MDSRASSFGVLVCLGGKMSFEIVLVLFYRTLPHALDYGARLS